jgi:hypothetical protein
MPTDRQIAGWQTATRPDLTGPYDLTNNTNPTDQPGVAGRGFIAGRRMTIGMPGSHGIDVVRVDAEIFTSSDTASAAMQYYASSFTKLGYNTPASTGNLPPTSWAMWATNGFIAPQFAMGVAPRVYVYVWRVDNMVTSVRAGGESTATNANGLQWASLVNSNIPPR